MRPILVLTCLALLLAPVASAGTALDPEISDPSGDGGADVLDIQRVWIDPSDRTHLALHATFGAAPPTLPPVQGTQPSTDACTTPQTCAYLSLSYIFTFRVLTPQGANAPQFPDYAFTHVAFRAGPARATLSAPIGYGDANGFLTFDGQSAATASVNGMELTLRLPRSSPFVNLPAGATPGAYRIDRLAVHSLPELCVPSQQFPTGTVACAPLAKPVAPTVSTPPGTSPRWDEAPDTGFGRIFTFPAPPNATTTPTQSVTTVTQTETLTVTRTFTHTQTGHPMTYTHTLAPPPGTTTSPPPATTTAPASSTTSGTSAPTQKSPGPELALLLAGVAALLAVRRRLSA